ncbi:MAG: metalloregulator ArsR/SmtB family transcription factor [Pseudomonadota bacterium]
MKKQVRPRSIDVPALDDDQAVELAEMFRLMGDASRLKIVLACLNGPVSVGDIAERVELSASLVSHHLRLLRAARLLRAERRGKQVFYQAADAHVSCVVADMVAHVREPSRHGD